MIAASVSRSFALCIVLPSFFRIGDRTQLVLGLIVLSRVILMIATVLVWLTLCCSYCRSSIGDLTSRDTIMEAISSTAGKGAKRQPATLIPCERGTSEIRWNAATALLYGLLLDVPAKLAFSILF